MLGCVVGAGYFSQFHLEAWSRMHDVRIAGVCDANRERAAAAAAKYLPDAQVFDDARAMFDALRPDFVDIATPPATHAALCMLAAEREIAAICQKPLAPTTAEAATIAEHARRYGARLMVHENFRWQPWHIELRRMTHANELGRVFSVYARSRLGDGWGPDAYLARQPYFRDYPRLLIYETGVHFIDVFRALLGEVTTVYARIARHNPAIKGEDACHMVLGFAGGATAIWDANRYNESEAADPRYTFCELRLDAENGHTELHADGRMRVKQLGQPARDHSYPINTRGFGGDCVFTTLRHFVDCLHSGAPFATPADDYVRVMQIMDAAYASAESGEVVDVCHPEGNRGV